MKLFLAGCGCENIWIDQDFYDFNRLQSFYYISSREIKKIKKYKTFMLDSGAFTFFKGNQNIDWIKYTNDYCNFINIHNIKYFFELDIDVINGLEYAEKLRKIIENKTQKKPIVVWRPSRGLKYWYKMINEYPYVAISASGMYDSAWTRKEEGLKIINAMVNEAHRNNTKVHGLGYTKLENMDKILFDSVDSTSWLGGSRYGYVCYFNGKTIKKIKPLNRIKTKEAAVNNFNEWIKFSQYMERHDEK